VTSGVRHAIFSTTDSPKWSRRPHPSRGWPLWTSLVRPGREHDTTALREHGEILPLLTVWTDDDLRVLGDLGYEGEAVTITVAYKKPKNAACTDVQQQFNRAHHAVRARVRRTT
jgi:hypothetical protein